MLTVDREPAVTVLPAMMVAPVRLLLATMDPVPHFTVLMLRMRNHELIHVQIEKIMEGRNELYILLGR